MPLKKSSTWHESKLLLYNKSTVNFAEKNQKNHILLKRKVTSSNWKLLSNNKLDVMFCWVTWNDCYFLLTGLLQNQTLLSEFSDDSVRVFPITFFYERNTKKSRRITAGLRKFYFGDGRIDNSSFEQLSKIYNDGVVGYPVNDAVKLLASTGHKEVYYYRFVFHGRYSYVYKPGTTTPYGKFRIAFSLKLKTLSLSFLLGGRWGSLKIVKIVNLLCLRRTQILTHSQIMK